MDAARLKSNKTGVYPCVILVLSMLVLPAVPAAVVAQDDNAVATLRQIGRKFAEISEKASPSVVVLTVDKPMPRAQLDMEPPGNPQPNRPDLPGTRPGSPGTQKFAQIARGLGIIVSNDGHILTCNHIVKGSKKIKAKLKDGREFEAEIVGTDPDTDIAVVKIAAKNLPVLKLGDSDAVKVGDWVVTLGNAMGAGHTFATGLVTAKNRNGMGMAPLEDYLQTSINLQLGDGGGPLLDLDGNVVGINFATFSAERGGGISFAIPINMAKGIYEQLIKTGTVERGFLGVSIQNLNAELAKALDIETTKGVIISHVIKDTAAEKAGIKKMDVIVEFNGKPVKSARQFILRVAKLKPDTQVELVVLRNGQRQNLTVTLGKRPQ
jgi:serine protease Do